MRSPWSSTWSGTIWGPKAIRFPTSCRSITMPARRGAARSILMIAGSDLVRDYITGNAIMWARDFKIDGLRIDAGDWLLDRSAKHILQEVSQKLDDLAAQTGKPILRTVEFDQNDPRMTLPVLQNGMGMDAQWCDNKHHALLTAASRDRSSYYVDFGSMEMVAKSLRQGIVYEGQYSFFHDRNQGAPYGDASPDRFITFWCNHDQIGNRSTGDRPHNAHRTQAGHGAVRPDHPCAAGAYAVAGKRVPAGQPVPVLLRSTGAGKTRRRSRTAARTISKPGALTRRMFPIRRISRLLNAPSWTGTNLPSTNIATR